MKRIIITLVLAVFGLYGTAQNALPGSVIADDTDEAALQTWLGYECLSGTLLYRKSLHGGNSGTLHVFCDNKGPTVLLVKTTNGRVFGTYRSISYTSTTGYSLADGSFLISFTDDTRTTTQNNEYHVYDNTSYGPTYGGGHDIYINGELTGGYTNPGNTYNCIVGTYHSSLCEEYYAGSFDTWTIEDLEVYAISGSDDVTNPDTPTLEDVTGECSATATVPTTSDDCAGTITGTTSDALTYSTQGTHIITWNFDDGNGNSIDVTQNVIIDDITNPDTPTLEDVTGECSATAIVTSTNDNCTGTLTGTTSDALSYSTQGSHIITWNFDDGNGNNIDVTQNVIIEDVTNPETPILEDVTGECTATATVPITIDNCAGAITGTTSDVLSYSTQGTHIITWNFDDGNGNSIDVTQNVIIDDITNPTITCIGDQEVNADFPNYYTVIGNEFDPILTDDNCETASLTNNFNSLTTLEGAFIPEGINAITWTITDNANNETQCSFNVLVNAFIDIETLQQNGISIFPNPAKEIVNLFFTKNNVQKILLSDINGKILMIKTIIEQNETIDLFNYESGVYIINIQTDKESFTTKIIKE